MAESSKQIIEVHLRATKGAWRQSVTRPQAVMENGCAPHQADHPPVRTARTRPGLSLDGVDRQLLNHCRWGPLSPRGTSPLRKSNKMKKLISGLWEGSLAATFALTAIPATSRALAAWFKRKHQPLAQTISAQRHRSLKPFPGEVERHCTPAQRAAAQDLAIPDASGEVRRMCCGDQLNAPRIRGHSGCHAPTAVLWAGSGTAAFQAQIVRSGPSGAEPRLASAWRATGQHRSASSATAIRQPRGAARPARLTRGRNRNRRSGRPP